MKAGNSINRQINKGSFVALAANGFAKGAQILTRGLITRAGGAYSLGIFEIVLSLTRWFAQIGQAGVPQSMVLFTSLRRTQKLWNELLNIFLQSLVTVILVTSSLMLVIYLLQDSIYDLLLEGNSDSTILLQVIILTLLLTVSQFLGAFFRGLKFFILDQVLNSITFPVFLFLVTGCYYFFRPDQFKISNILFWVILLFSVVITVFLLYAFYYLLKSTKTWKWNLHFREIYKYSWPIWINSILNSSRAQFAKLLIPVLSTTTELGFFSAAFSIAFLTSFINTGFNPVNQSLVAEAYSENDYTKINHVYDSVLRKSSFFVTIALGGIFLFGRTILDIIFGSGFEVVYPLLLILTVGEAVNTLSGPAGNILLMTGNQKVSTRIMAVGFVVLCALAVILIPNYGALGAAIAYAVSIIFINLARLWMIRKLFNIRPDYFLLLKSNRYYLFLVCAIFFLSFLFQSDTGNYILYIVYAIIGMVLLLRSFKG